MASTSLLRSLRRRLRHERPDEAEELRAIEANVDADIRSLGYLVKSVNLLLMPAIVTALGLLVALNPGLLLADTVVTAEPVAMACIAGGLMLAWCGLSLLWTPFQAAAADRYLSLVATLAVASIVVFVVLDLLPGNAAEVMLGPTATPEQVAALQETIMAARAAGTNASELLDQRDLLLERITTAVGGTVRYEDDGTATLYLGDSGEVFPLGAAVGRMDVRSEIAELVNRDGLRDYPATDIRFQPDEVIFTPGTRSGLARLRVIRDAAWRPYATPDGRNPASRPRRLRLPRERCAVRPPGGPVRDRPPARSTRPCPSRQRRMP